MNYLRFVDSGKRNGMPERQILVNDLSGSMDTRDWKPSRLGAAKQAAIALLKVKGQSFPDDEVGIVGFASGARVIHPPVSVGEGLEGLKHALKRLKTEGSTNITAGLKAAETLLFPETVNDELDPKELFQRFSNWLWGTPQVYASPLPRPSYIPRVLVLTDGHHNTGWSPLPVAQRLKDRGVLIDCVGIGGSPEKVDEPQLKAIASQNPDLSIRYCFIGDKSTLIQKYEQLANRIRPA